MHGPQRSHIPLFPLQVKDCLFDSLQQPEGWYSAFDKLDYTFIFFWGLIVPLEFNGIYI